MMYGPPVTRFTKCLQRSKLGELLRYSFCGSNRGKRSTPQTLCAFTPVKEFRCVEKMRNGSL